MSRFSFNLVRCSVAALIFTFAVTADVLVKAVVDDQGHDANNPIIWIEHKCAGHFGKTTQNHVLPQTVIAVALSVPNQVVQDIPFAPRVLFLQGSLLPESPGSKLTTLRC